MTTSMAGRAGFVLLGLLMAGSVSAAELSFREGDGKPFSATSAATIEERKGGRTRLGAKALVHLEEEYGKPEHKLSQGLLGFQKIIGTKSGQIPPGSNIHSAKLTLVFENPGEAKAPVTLHLMLKPWKEAEVCWKERAVGEAFGNASSFVMDKAAALRVNHQDPIDPGGGMPGVDYSKSVIDAQPTIKGLVTFNVTKAVQAWAAGRPNYGLYLQYLNANSAQFHSDDAPNKGLRPLLKVRFTADGTGVAPTGGTIFLIDPQTDLRLGPLTPGQTPSVELAGNRFALDWQKVRNDWSLTLRSARTGRTYGPVIIRYQSAVNLGGIRLLVSGE